MGFETILFAIAAFVVILLVWKVAKVAIMVAIIGGGVLFFFPDALTLGKSFFG